MLTLKKAQQTKAFKKGDLIIYIVLIVLIITLFLVFFSNKDKSDNVGFEVILDEITILTYNFNTEKYSITTGYQDNFAIEKDASGLFITIFADKSQKHYNKISIDNVKKHVYMLDSNCSSAKDCTKISIKKSNDVIVCVPHKLKVKGLSEDIQQPISG